MKDKRFFKLGVGNYITDSVVVPVDSYIEFIGEIPVDILGGYYKLENGCIILDPDKKQELRDIEIQLLQDEAESLRRTINEMKKSIEDRR